MDKKAMRRYIRQQKAQHTDEELRMMSEGICRRLLGHPRVKAADTVLAYWALPDEVCTHRLLDELLAEGKTVLLPKVVGDTEMTLHRYTGSDSLVAGAYGIMEPSAGTQWQGLRGERQQVDVAIVPGMAFDSAGHRLGRGKGYYDRLFGKQAVTYRIGACFPCQLLPAVPTAPHDVVMDEVVSLF